MLLETPSRGRVVRFQEPPASEQEAAGAGGHEPTSVVKGAASRAAPSFELQEDPSFWKDHNVQVAIRIRPLSSAEISLQGHNRCVRQDSCQSITWTGHPESRFTFDLVADEYVTQEKLFKVAGVPMVDNCISGYNSCMFAYGQTGSGKTHTMLGDIEGACRHSVNCGMTPRVFEYLFLKIQKEKESRKEEKVEFTCKCSFLEIYNEQILDLLDPSSVNLQIREDAKIGVHVENLKEFEVTSARDVMQQLLQGAANRKVAATNMNRASSRSHSVFTCAIESKWESQGITHHRFSRLNLVDLAGSERQKSSGAEGERLKEATNINKSLSTLGLVIMNLVSMSKQKSLHVPYRDSKLTFLLQDSLGGNSKTIIIANISPSNCCALETMSTLKFAQRAKFIRNNAIINEEASGDVLSMRLQIQQLKKEINHLRGLVHGGTEHQESDNLNATFPGSPGSFKWEGVHGSFSPLTFDKRISQRKEYDVALVAALRRDQDKEKVLKALTAEKETVEQLASQRTDEVQSLKMRLRFREEGIKRLEAVASGKLSADSHLLQEKEELLKEIEVLRNQVDRNPEVRRFAMENLRLKEELRRLQSFVEEGEREMMNDQITALQEQLLEALDWKLMHEKGLGVQDLSLSWDSSINEENEFLHLQAIQNQREVEALRKNLNFCLEAKEKLERHVDELIVQLEDERKLHNTLCEARQPPQISSQTADDQTELKTMVDAIAAASQREAEAHEMAITLAKENEKFRLKLNVLIEDNSKLIELYENAVPEGVARKGIKVDFETVEDHGRVSEHLGISRERKVAGDLDNQLHDMHEENEKLMNLYEQAMQERDEFKRLLQEQKNGRMEEEISFSEKLVEIDNRGTCLQDKDGESSDASYTEFVKVTQERLDLARMKLDIVCDKLATVERVVDSFALLEKTVRELNNVEERTIKSDGDIHSKQQEIELLKTVHGGTHERVNIMGNKLFAAKFALQSLSPDMNFWRQREECARTKLDVHMKSIEQRKRVLEVLQSQKRETDAAWSQASQSETQLRGKLNSLKSAYKVAEGQREETKKVLFAIDNLDPADIPLQRAGWNGKAIELLKSEEEVTKLAAEVKQLREKISTVQKDATNSRKMSEELDSKLKDLEEEMRSEALLLEKAESEFQKVSGENDVILGMRKERMAEFWDLVMDYQESVFSLDVQTTEIQMHEDELQLQVRTLEELITARRSATENLNLFLEECDLLSGADDCSRCTSEKVVGELGHMQGTILEARSLLFGWNDER